MRRDIDSLARSFDLLVVGAGIHGACVARLAAMSGLRTALIERGDFGGATSRNSAKLIHGGLRYIQHFDVPRIRESMRAQRAWFRFAPHLVRPLEFVIPTYGYGTRGPVALAGGIAAFHVIAAGRNRGIRADGRLPRSGVMSRGSLVAAHPMLDRADVTGGAYWYDGQMLDAARLSLECVWDACSAGAVAANHVEAMELLHDSGGVRGVGARDRITGKEFEIRARMTLNATGPWVDRFLGSGPTRLRGRRTTAWTRNVNLVTRRLYQGETALGVQSDRVSDAAVGKSKRLFFASPWHGCTVVGTMHDLYDADPDEIVVTDELVSQFVAEVSAAAPGLGLRVDDVRSVHLGLTPAEDSETERAKRSLLIDHASTDDLPGLVSLAGIKYTTAPVVALQTLELIGRHFGCSVERALLEAPAIGAGGGAADRSGQSIGGVFPVPTELAWARQVYGLRARDCIGTLEPQFGEEEAVFRARVRFGIEMEMVVRLSDALLRATDWAERGMLTKSQFDWCEQTLADRFGWNEKRRAEERADTLGQLGRHRIQLSAARAADSDLTRVTQRG